MREEISSETEGDGAWSTASSLGKKKSCSPRVSVLDVTGLFQLLYQPNIQPKYVDGDGECVVDIVPWCDQIA